MLTVTRAEQYRVNHIPYFPKTKVGDKFGVFQFQSFASGRLINIIVDDGTAEVMKTGWEHVSVSVIHGTKSRIPTWEEMCKVKDLFWDKDDCVIQYHPPESKYINNHPNVLHLWRPIGIDIPMPPLAAV